MSGLRARLVERIRADGPLTFAAYMEAALFDPAEGFYARGPALGTGGHFTTSAEAHPAFAAAIAAEAITTWEALDRPADFRVVEAGPGSGVLAARVAAQLAEAGVPFALALVERSAGLIEQQRAALAGVHATWVADAADLPPAPGLVYANELIDALPVHLLAWPDEVLVSADDGGRLIEVRTPAPPDLQRLVLGVDPRSGGRYAVRPAAAELLARLAGALAGGRLLLVDYGGVGAEVHDGRRPPVRTYIGGQPGGDPLAAPGTQDLTADVDFGALTADAERLGLRDVRLRTQAAWLAGHGWSVPPPAERTEDDWLLAGLLDECLPFMVWSAER